MTVSERVTKHIDDLGDWRGKLIAHLRKLIRDAAPELVEEWKWNTPVWSHKGNVLSVGAFRDHVKVKIRGTPSPAAASYTTSAIYSGVEYVSICHVSDQPT